MLGSLQTFRQERTRQIFPLFVGWDAATGVIFDCIYAAAVYPAKLFAVKDKYMGKQHRSL